MKSLSIILSALIFCSAAIGAEAAKTASVHEVTNENFKCGKFTSSMTLAEFKEELLKNCDLNKPFSSSLSRFAGEDAYFYCCQKK